MLKSPVTIISLVPAVRARRSTTCNIASCARWNPWWRLPADQSPSLFAVRWVLVTTVPSPASSTVSAPWSRLLTPRLARNRTPPALGRAPRNEVYDTAPTGRRENATSPPAGGPAVPRRQATHGPHGTQPPLT